MDTNSGLFKMKKFAADAGTLFNRAVQFTEEKLGQAEKTELDAHFENLLQRADKTKIWTEKVLKQTECLLQPNPNVRMEDFFYEKLDKKKRDRVSHHELLGQIMTDAGNEFGPGTSYGNALVKTGATQINIGNAEKEFVQSTANNFLQPLRNFLDGDMKTIQKEKKILEVKRLDLDAAKTKNRRAKSQNTQDDAVARAEADLRIAQTEFDRQAEITKLLLEGVNSAHAHHLRCLNDFIEAQMTYYAQCQQYMADLQRQLGRSVPGEFLQAFQALLEDHIKSSNEEAKKGSYSVGSGNSSTNSLGPGIPNSTLPVQPSAPPMIHITAATPSTEKKQARVLYDYDAADNSELSLLADELITVYKVPGLDPDWLMAERGSQKGKVPNTYLEVLE